MRDTGKMEWAGSSCLCSSDIILDYEVIKYTKSVNYDLLIMHTELFAGLNADPKVGQHNVQSHSEILF